jgi:hypothetical protein
MVPANTVHDLTLPLARPALWWAGIGWTEGPEAIADRYDRPLSALVEAVRHGHDVGAVPDLAAIRRRLTRIEAGIAGEIARGGCDRGIRAALEMVQGKARATRDWLAAIAGCREVLPRG